MSDEDSRTAPAQDSMQDDQQADDAAQALAALASDEGAHETDAPDPLTLTSPMPPLEDIPDDVPLPAAPAGADPDGQLFAAAAPGQTAAQDPSSTEPLDAVEVAALAMDADSPSQTLPFAPVKPTAAASAVASDRISGAARGTGALAWGSRTDVGRVRSHNEDSFVIRFPMFAVADGMGGHAAGEVASTIAVSKLASAAPGTPDDAALGAAIEAANTAVLEGAANGSGRPGMGTTCTAVVIDGSTMAVGHVGDSRCYLLHAGQLVRVTHDHSYVEELVAAGEITPEEARVHPNRSIITRALGSDPAMKADHFTVDVARGDRVLLCSDGLSSMVEDGTIEEAMVCSPAPQACADALVDLALAAGGHDNVTCVVIDVKDDGVASRALRMRVRNLLAAAAVVLAVLLVAYLALFAVSQRYWYLADDNGYVAVYQGFPGTSALGLARLQETTSVRTELLSDAVATRLAAGITCNSEDEAYAAVESYREQTRPASSAQSGGTATSTSSSDVATSTAVPTTTAASSAEGA